MQSALIDYYSCRAPEYELIYQRPERLANLRALTSFLPALVAGCDMLELACGTGYWTERMAPAARSWLATDLSIPMLEMAQTKRYPAGRVRFAPVDAYSLSGLPGRFNALVAGFLWSHLPRERLPALLAALARRLEAGSRAVFFDNRYVPGNSLPIVRQDPEGNTYQSRQLSDGSRHEVMKNFPTVAQLLAAPPPGAHSISVIELRYFWCLTYRAG
jgi:SAM-dependent methyltransferase